MPNVGYEIAAPDVIAEALDGEVLIVNLATGVYFRGDAGVAQAWAAVTSGVAHSQSKLSVNPALAAFVDELLAEGIVLRDTPSKTIWEFEK